MKNETKREKKFLRDYIKQFILLNNLGHWTISILCCFYDPNCVLFILKFTTLPMNHKVQLKMIK